MPTNKDKLSLYICIYINRIYPVNAMVVVKLFSFFSDKTTVQVEPQRLVHASLKDCLYIGRIQVHATHTETCKALQKKLLSIKKKGKKNQPGPARTNQNK